MDKKYLFERKANLWISIFAAVMFGLIIIFFATNSAFAVLNQNGSYSGILLLILVILILGFVSFFPYIVAVTGFLKLKNGVLSRTYLGVKIWSTPVSNITDIYRGNLASSSNVLQMRGLTFRTVVAGKSHLRQAPSDIVNDDELISDLASINDKIQMHDNPVDLKKIVGAPFIDEPPIKPL
jgi:hypothetical protein